jgi:hypothetical protein
MAPRGAHPPEPRSRLRQGRPPSRRAPGDKIVSGCHGDLAAAPGRTWRRRSARGTQNLPGRCVVLCALFPRHSGSNCGTEFASVCKTAHLGRGPNERTGSPGALSCFDQRSGQPRPRGFGTCRARDSSAPILFDHDLILRASRSDGGRFRGRCPTTPSWPAPIQEQRARCCTGARADLRLRAWGRFAWGSSHPVGPRGPIPVEATPTCYEAPATLRLCQNDRRGPVYSRGRSCPICLR